MAAKRQGQSSSRVESYRRLFFTMDRDELENRDDDYTDKEPEIEKSEKESKGLGGSTVSSRFWLDKIESKVDSNRERSLDNRYYLARLDYRTVWIIRLLVALTATIAGAVMIDIIL